MISFSVFSSMELLSSFMSFFFSLHFFTLKGQRHFYLLGAFLVAFAGEIAMSLFEPHYVYSSLWAFGNAWLYLPFLYLYIISVHCHAFRFTPRMLGWFIPWALDATIKIYGLAYMSASPNQVDTLHIYELASGFLAYAYALGLLTLSLKHLRKHARNKATQWLKQLVIILMVFNLVWLSEDIAHLLFPNNWFAEQIPMLSSFFTLITVVWVGLYTLTPSVTTEPITLVNQKKKIVQPLPTDKQQDIYANLEQLLKTEKVYTQPNLTLGYLSEQLGIKSKMLSQVIFEETGAGYYDLINKWRIEEFKRLLSAGHTQQLSIEGLAKQVGFKSKSTLYTHFKKIEHLTPKQYLQQLGQV